jgi:glycosyltransferase involved in cell wall biosynthesis
MSLVSIIITAYYREKQLFALLKSINKINYIKKDLRIILVIDGFKISKKKLLNSSKFKLKILNNNQNMGPSFSRNKALNIANSKYIWFLDSDALILKKNTLKNMIKHINKNNVDGITGYIEKIDGVYKVQTPNFYRNFLNIEKFTELKKFDSSRNNFFAQTSLFVVKKDFLKKYGYYDNKLRIKEDEELAYRIKANNRSFLFKKDTLVEHCPYLISKDSVIEHIFRVIKTRQYVTKKNKENPLSFILYDPLMILDFIYKRTLAGKNFTSRRVSQMRNEYNIKQLSLFLFLMIKFYFGFQIK